MINNAAFGHFTLNFSWLIKIPSFVLILNPTKTMAFQKQLHLRSLHYFREDHLYNSQLLQHSLIHNKDSLKCQTVSQVIVAHIL